jgi:cell division protein FtsZ
MAAASLMQELQPQMAVSDKATGISSSEPILNTGDENPSVDNLLEKKPADDTQEWILSRETITFQEEKIIQKIPETNSPKPAVSGGYLARPSNIYSEESRSEKESAPDNAPVKDSILNSGANNPPREDETASEMQLVFKDAIPAADVPWAHQTPHHSTMAAPAEEPAMQDEAEEQRRRAAERINKLRNLSFNINAADPNNEFETVPAYIRRNLELYNTISSVEDFYSNYEVKSDENNNTEITTINTFLDGKKPD